MNKFKIVIEYDGTNYVGWQKQDNGKSIQGSIEEAIYKLSGEKVVLFGAGRTDAGVHALGQVAHFILTKKFKTNNIRDGLNQHLKPNTISILKVEEVDKDFHARFTAKKRTYKYLIINRRAPLTVDKNRSWIVFKKLNLEKMIHESKSFIGKHDFQAFRSIHCQSHSSIKTLDDIKIDKFQNNFTIQISAKSFLHSQVRIMVGTLVEIGKDKIKKSLKNIIDEKNRSGAGITAPPSGLYLLNVDY